MKVPFHLRKREAPAPTAALWVASADLAHLAALWAKLGDAPETFAVAGGFVVILGGPAPAGLPRAVWLRRLAGNLYLPADADLVPELQPAEADDLTRTRGLLILPGGSALAFDPARPLAPAAVIAPAEVRRAAWEPFPPRPARAERLQT